MFVPCIGQTIPFSTSDAVPSVTVRSGNAHTVPITWHKVKKNTSAQYCILTRRGIGPTMFLQDLLDSPLLCSAKVMPERPGKRSITHHLYFPRRMQASMSHLEPHHSMPLRYFGSVSYRCLWRSASHRSRLFPISSSFSSLPLARLLIITSPK